MSNGGFGVPPQQVPLGQRSKFAGSGKQMSPVPDDAAGDVLNHEVDKPATTDDAQSGVGPNKQPHKQQSDKRKRANRPKPQGEISVGRSVSKNVCTRAGTTGSEVSSNAK
jgi:hypothetical protein